jgi:hypothetical protein
VAALIYGLLTMVDAAFEHKEEFYILDSLDETKLYNSARNMEIAVWKLSTNRDAAGDLFLLSNELDPANRNRFLRARVRADHRPARFHGENCRRPQWPDPLPGGAIRHDHDLSPREFLT